MSCVKGASDTQICIRSKLYVAYCEPNYASILSITPPQLIMAVKSVLITDALIQKREQQKPFSTVSLAMVKTPVELLQVQLPRKPSTTPYSDPHNKKMHFFWC